MQTGMPERRPWYTRRSYQVVVGVVVAILLLSLVSNGPPPPPSATQRALGKAVYYLERNYNITVGLIPETPTSNTFWLYSDNYLASLAISRYPQQNQTMSDFALALSYSLDSFSSTYPGDASQNQYLALNSTAAPFACARSYTLGWSTTPSHSGKALATAVIKTTVNDDGSVCASPADNFADVLLLEAVHEHRSGNESGALALYRVAGSDFDGVGFADRAYTDANSSSYHTYQTYKAALFVYASVCLGQSTASSQALSDSRAILNQTQSADTGGFSTSYSEGVSFMGPLVVRPSGSVNTETTALAALALEMVLSPTSAC